MYDAFSQCDLEVRKSRGRMSKNANLNGHPFWRAPYLIIIVNNKLQIHKTDDAKCLKPVCLSVR